jgi:UDP-N-acetylmuramoyl-tripeptide--D-alanyl-D-alanine ligase
MLMHWSLAEVAKVLGCRVSDMDSQRQVGRVLTDSRQLQAGDLFVALMGSRVDGHDFVPQLAAQGVVAAIVQREVAGAEVVQLVVPDTVVALQQLAAAWRAKQQLAHMLVVTGSNGKTSVKEMLASVLRVVDGQVLATEGNLNNHLGLPMTLLALRAQHRSAVVEVGANHVGEIAKLAALAQPDVAIITSIGVAHIGEFGSLSAIITAKGEILPALPEQGLAVLPVWSDALCDQAWSVWRPALVNKQWVAFGDVTVDQFMRFSQRWVGVAHRQSWGGHQSVTLLTSDWGEKTLHLPLPSAHQARNLAALAAALLPLGVSWSQIQQGLPSLVLPSGRLRVLTLCAGLTLIDDSYNANPSSVLAAMDTLMEYPAQQKGLLLGAMGELGDTAEIQHQAMALAAQQAGVNQLWVAGDYALAMSAVTYGYAQPIHDPIRWAEMVWSWYQQHLSLVLLVKGSRSSRMEQYVVALIEKIGHL